LFSAALALGLVQTFMLLSADVAAAQATGAAQPPAWAQFLPFIVMFAVMYFLMIRPQMKKQKEHQEFLSTLKRGSEVVTNSGIFGRVEGLTDTTVTLEIASGVSIKVLRGAIAGSSKAATTSATEVKA
jgi:preprotein translocase subunit YajC